MPLQVLRSYLPYALIGVACFALGVLLSGQFSSSERNFSLREGKGSYTFINPLLLCRSGDTEEFSEFAPLKKQIEHITMEAKNDGKILSGSVYFRDLTSGNWTGINEDSLYNPASLLKLPILIAYFKKSESDPAALDRTIAYVQEPGQAPPLIEKPILTSGKSYSVLDLLRGMIIDSDNTAKDILEAKMDKAYLSEVYSELGIGSPYAQNEDYQISTRAYALFFRVLYNATLLGKTSSERALSMLSEVRFDKGLRAGTPEDIMIAHKYGYSIIREDNPRTVELSDCGIVYEPTRPYLLCVMAQGYYPDITATYIRDIASASYNLVEN